MADPETDLMKKNQHIFTGVGAVLGAMTAATIGGPLVVAIGAGLGGFIGYKMLARIGA